jgi:hypothetical protein
MISAILRQVVLRLRRSSPTHRAQPLDPAIIALHVSALSAIKEGFDGVLFERLTRVASGSEAPPDPLLDHFLEDEEASVQDNRWRIRDYWCAYMLKNGHRAGELCPPDARFDSIVELLAPTQPSWQPDKCVNCTFVADDGKTTIDLAITVTESYPIIVTVKILNEVPKEIAASTLRTIYAQ